jgi:hypothetical protein
MRLVLAKVRSFEVAVLLEVFVDLVQFLGFDRRVDYGGAVGVFGGGKLLGLAERGFKRCERSRVPLQFGELVIVCGLQPINIWRRSRQPNVSSGKIRIC